MRNTDKIIDSYTQDMVKHLQELIQIESVKSEPVPGAPFGANIQNALDYTLDLCRSLGMEAEDVDGYAGYAQVKGEKPEQLGVLCHLDVVPAGDGWLHQPFNAELENGIIYGRGTVDNKGPAIAAIYALKALMDSGVTFVKTPRIIFGCDEESGWECMDYYSKKIGMPEMGFSPDADYPIINTEKGIYHATFKRKLSGTGAYKLSIKGGSRPNVVPDLAHAHIEGNIDKLFKTLIDYDCTKNGLKFTVEGNSLDITATGVSAHACMPDNGQNAFFSLIKLLDKLTLGGEEGQFIQMLNCALVYKTDGNGINGLKLSDEFGPLTINLGIMNMGDFYGGNADEISFTVDVRFPVSYNYQYVEECLTKAFPEWILQRGHVQAPHHTPEDHELIISLKKVYKEYFNKEARCVAIGGGTYARALSTGVAFGITPEGESSPAHNKDESISVESLVFNAKIFAAAIEELTTK